MENENKDPIRVSVIVPIYNAESYLRICLDSILQQSLEEIEILAVDDGSKDQSAKILREYEKKYPDKIHVIYQENQGQSAARNHALAMASGEFVAFVDSDDYIGKDFLKRMYNTAIEKKSDMVMCNYTKVTERGEIIQKYEINYQEKGIRIPSYLCCNRLVRRQLFDTWKIYFREGVICEDIPLILKLEAVATNIQTIGDGEYYYRANPQSTTSTIKNRKLEMWQLPFGELRDAIAFCTDKEHPMDPLKLEFFICRIMTSLLFDTGRGCRKEVKDGMCREVQEIMETCFPRCYKNPYIKVGYFHQLPAVQKIGPWIFVCALRVHGLKLLAKLVG